MRGAVWLVAALLIGLAVHLIGIMAMPMLAGRTGQRRLATLIMGAGFQPVLPDAMPGLDPALTTAVCRYDLSAGAVRVHVPADPALVSLAFYPWRGPAFAALPPDAAKRGGFDVRLELRPTTAKEPPVSLHLTAPMERGFVLLRLVGDAVAQRAVLAGASCGPDQGL